MYDGLYRPLSFDIVITNRSILIVNEVELLSQIPIDQWNFFLGAVCILRVSCLMSKIISSGDIFHRRGILECPCGMHIN